MGTVFYGLSGEGRGHATRARTVAEGLREQGHRVVIFAPDLAFDLLQPTFAGTDTKLVRISGLRYVYDRKTRVSFPGTLAATAGYAAIMHRRVARLIPFFERERPDLVIADFEPLLPRAARLCGVPFVSLDHQHYLAVNDFSTLPFGLRAKAAFCAPLVRALYDWQAETIVSSFYALPIKPGLTNVRQVGVLLRPEILRLRPHRGGYLVVYVRRFANGYLFDALTATGLPVHFYGLGARPQEGKIKFFEVDEQRFMDDLAGCEAVVSTAGNQLVGEALYLRKPVLAIAEKGNFEQSINGHFLNASGAGIAVGNDLSMVDMLDFVGDLDRYRLHIVPERVCGNAATQAALAAHLRGNASGEHAGGGTRRKVA